MEPNPFPKETVRAIAEDINKKNTFYPNAKIHQWANVIMRWGQNVPYGFIDCLRTGVYAPYQHEGHQLRIQEWNCTTLIPTLYTHCDIAKLKPQIVQFIDFRDIVKKKDKDDFQDWSHYALVVDIGRDKPYLLDPQRSCFGPILQQRKRRWRMGAHNGYHALTREFREMKYISAKDFASMMARLREPGESLDMLIGGQIVFKDRYVAKTNCDVRVYYDDTQNTITSRLYISQIEISDKAVYCHRQFDDKGETKKVTLDLYVAKEASWKELVDGRKIATTTIEELYTLKRALPEPFKPKKRQSLSQILQDSVQKEKVLGIAATIQSHLTTTELKSIQVPILVRTLYEAVCQQKEYAYTQKEHDREIRRLKEEKDRVNYKILILSRKQFNAKWKLHHYPQKTVDRWRRQRKKLNEQYNEFNQDLEDLLDCKKDNKETYHRNLDMVLFAERMEGKSASDLQRMVAKKKLDPKVGYAAMVVDFLPFVQQGRKDLELTLFLESIQGKVAARFKKKRR
ncbi:MAG: hypothetical protein Q7K45_06480 [Nanoarchaeota archaeon]|nr:hypothetical protein [Nanoarchaeota archaeon]